MSSVEGSHGRDKSYGFPPFSLLVTPLAGELWTGEGEEWLSGAHGLNFSRRAQVRLAVKGRIFNLD